MVLVPPYAPIVVLAFPGAGALVVAGAAAEDRSGRRYLPRPDATAALVRAGRASTPVTRSLKPGDSYRTLLVFDVPRNARELRLYVGNRPEEGAFLVGHEASPVAKKSWFAID